MATRQYDVTCLMCATQVGEIKEGNFVAHAGCKQPHRKASGRAGCCRCGGSLYLEPSSINPPAQVNKAAQAFEEERGSF